jgi:hypothetical protein
VSSEKDSTTKKSVRDRARDSFNKDDKEQIYEYLDWLRSTLREYVQNMRRMVAVLFLLAAAFELVANSRNASISIGSFRVTRNSIVLDFLPVAVAFLFLQVSVDGIKSDQLSDLFTEIFGLWSEKAEMNDLDVPVKGSAPVYWNPFAGTYRPGNLAGVDKLEGNVATLLIGIIFLGVLAFEGHAYYILFPALTIQLVLWIISLTCTLFCLTFALLSWLA